MSLSNTANDIFSRLKLPGQELSALSFCSGPKAAKVRAWVETLPATRMNHTSALLYKALPEVCHLKTDPDNRLQILETLRPYVQQCIQGLTRHFLNQPLVLPQNARKTAIVAQALQKHMTLGYMLVVRDIVARLKKNNEAQKKMLALVLHRAITGLSLLLLRSFQLYTPVPAQLWLEIHSIYRLADALELLQLPVVDPLLELTRAGTVQQAYLRILMLACARPNQLRQNDIALIYAALENWVAQVNLNTTGEQRRENLFIVNLGADMGPMYKSRLRGSLNDETRELDAGRLLEALKKQSDRPGETSGIIKVPRQITPALIDHLTATWGILRQRNFERRLANGELQVVVGISNLHFHISDGVPFEDLLSGGKPSDRYANLSRQRRLFATRAPGTEYDPWEKASDAAGSRRMEINFESEEANPQEEEHPIYTVHMLDSSAGGYCLDWRDENRVQVRAGELLGLREPGRRKWSVGVVRWLRQNRGATQLGVQILAPMATPYGASMIQKTGSNSEYMRVLMLPELKAIQQPATLLTAAVPFQEYCKVNLSRHGEEQTIQLTRRLFATGSVSQFSFRVLESLSSSPPEENQAEDFDSVWNGD